MKKIVSAISLMLCMVLASHANGLLKDDRFYSFEDESVLSFIRCESSSVSVEGKHYKDGVKSLLWDFEANGMFSLHRDIGFEKKDPTGKDTYMSTFAIWIYNEEAVDDVIKIEFLKDGKVCSHFPFGINFTGWRAAWVCFERDMEGVPQEEMNEMRIIAPDRKGKLYIDHMVTASKVDTRHQTPDVQVPFVNKNTTNHWMVIYKKSLLKPDLPLESLDEESLKDIKIMERRFRDIIYTPAKLKQKELDNIWEVYNSYGIVEKDGVITGKPVFLFNNLQIFERIFPVNQRKNLSWLGIAMHDYYNFMRKVAVAYNNAGDETTRNDLKWIFMNLYRHIVDQGVAYGSCWGNIHHYGYSMRPFYLACYLMKDVLAEAGKLEEASAMLRWYAITNEVYPRPEKNGISIDALNTQVTGRLASILIMEDSPEKLRYIRSFSRWIDYGCRPASGLEDSFKTDGAAFHHGNHYPAYAVGGLTGAVNMIYVMNGTRFAVSEEAHATVKSVLLTMRFYCNTYQWSLAMSARHPNGKGKLIPEHFAVMAKAGSPDGEEKYDKELAEAFLRLISFTPASEQSLVEREMKNVLEKEGFKAESDPQGHKVLGYGCSSIHRRDNWAAIVRGHSRYIWGSEHYENANYYGRYLGYGTLQVLTGKPGEMVTLKTSGWQENGFDWNRIPGATSIHLPFEQLKARVLNVDTFSGYEEMLYSDEAFAGGLSFEGQNGNFGMKLHEHDKYNGSLRARKSYHFLDNVIVCLGSNIENIVKDYNTETTVFQTVVDGDAEKEFWQKQPAGSQIYLAPNGIGYYIPKNYVGKTEYICNYPQITVGERSTEPTQGDWVSLVFNHGKAPKNSSYEYVVFPRVSVSELKGFKKKPAYRVLRHDENAHIVSFPKNKLTSYVLFEPGVELPDKGILMRADTSCLVMLQECGKEKIRLSVSQPDLALYRGPSDELYDENGKRVERSIYSRPWYRNESKPIPVTVTLKGRWKIDEKDGDCRILQADRKHTVIQFICKDASSYNVELEVE